MSRTMILFGNDIQSLTLLKRKMTASHIGIAEKGPTTDYERLQPQGLPLRIETGIVDHRANRHMRIDKIFGDSLFSD